MKPPLGKNINQHSHGQWTVQNRIFRIHVSASRNGMVLHNWHDIGLDKTDHPMKLLWVLKLVNIEPLHKFLSGM